MIQSKWHFTESFKKKDEHGEILLPHRINVGCNEIISSVDQILSNHCIDIQSQLLKCIPSTNCGNHVDECQMQSEKITLSEMNVGLWEAALNSAISDTSLTAYPHYLVVQKIVNYVLNVSSSAEGHSKATLFFSKLISMHHLRCCDLQYYYDQILFSQYVMFSSKSVEEENLFWSLVNALISAVSDQISITGDFEIWKPTSQKETRANQVSELTDWLNENKSGCAVKMFQKHMNKKTALYFTDLPPNEKVKRAFICLKFVCDILESDLLYWYNNIWLVKNSFKKGAPILCRLIWTETRDIGLINNNIVKVLHLQQNLAQTGRSNPIVDRLVCLIAAIVCCSDSLLNPTYPSLASNCNDLARTCAMHLLEKQTLDGAKSTLTDCAMAIEPPWLQLLVTTHILSSLTGNQWTPQLETAAEILEHISEMKSETQDEGTSGQKRERIAADPVLVARYSKLKSVNARLRSGFTRLHAACYSDNVKEVRALLVFGELDVNTTDHSGWTALHQAAFRGSRASMEELLHFSPALGDVRRPVNTRARGQEDFTPLMCAVVSQHADICQILLQHTGSVLLEDITNDNKTAADLATCEEVNEVLDFYKRNVLLTKHSRQKMYFTDDKIIDIIELCTQMVGAYFNTHKTWEVYHLMKRKAISQEKEDIQNENSRSHSMTVQFDYMRYFRDLKTNLTKLRSVVGKLKRMREYKAFLTPLISHVSMNKR